VKVADGSAGASVCWQIAERPPRLPSWWYNIGFWRSRNKWENLPTVAYPPAWFAGLYVIDQLRWREPMNLSSVFQHEADSSVRILDLRSRPAVETWRTKLLVNATCDSLLMLKMSNGEDESEIHRANAASAD
jgi:hypothetical protein